MLTPAKLKRLFPWINTDGIALASYCSEGEGTFDSFAFLTNLKLKLKEMGVDFVSGDVYNVTHEIPNEYVHDDNQTTEEALEHEMTLLEQRPIECHVHLGSGDGDVWPLHFSQLILACGAEAGHVANLAGIGSGRGMLAVPLPVIPRKMSTYLVEAPNGPGLNCPVVRDPSGLYFRRQGLGGHFLCTRYLQEGEKSSPIDTETDADMDYFEEKIRPELERRFQGFTGNLKVQFLSKSNQFMQGI